MSIGDEINKAYAAFTAKFRPMTSVLLTARAEGISGLGAAETKAGVGRLSHWVRSREFWLCHRMMGFSPVDEDKELSARIVGSQIIEIYDEDAGHVLGEIPLVGVNTLRALSELLSDFADAKEVAQVALKGGIKYDS